jgi:hypothetical protein
MTNAAAAKPRPAALVAGQTVTLYGRTLTVIADEVEVVGTVHTFYVADATDGERTYRRDVFHSGRGWRATWMRQ